MGLKGYQKAGHFSIIFSICFLVLASQVTSADPTCEDCNLTRLVGGRTDNILNVNDMNALVDYIANNRTGSLWVVNCNTCDC